MKKTLLTLFCIFFTNSVLAGTSALFTLGPYFKDGKMVRIKSFNSGSFPNEFMSLKDGSYKNSPVNIDALLVYPKKGK